jgi:restriction system protein
MILIDAAEIILDEAGKPLHYQEITKRILQKELWQTEGLTPEATLNARIAMDIKVRGEHSRFQRIAPGVFALQKWALQPQLVKSEKQVENSTPKYSFTDAAEIVLDTLANQQPMHYRTITEHILDLELVNTEGKTPEATLYAQILTEIRRHSERGDTPRFVQLGKGMLGLRKWMSVGLVGQIEKHNRKVRVDLREHLFKVTPQEFEQLIGRLLAQMGFEEVEVTHISGDGGIDVRGVLVVGDVIRTRMAIQAKRWQGHNVQAPTVQQVRGSLGAHEQGMIITTSSFSKGAQDEAMRANATPVALVDGEQLVELLIEHEVLVKRVSYELINLNLEED